jgi:hypothetical protein
MNLKTTDIADKSAIAISVICVLHCLLTPVLLVSVPLLAGASILQGEVLHVWLLCLIIPISAISIASGFLKHRDKGVLFFATGGIVFLIAALVLGHDLHERLGEVMMTIFGSLLIASAHIRNLKLRRMMN